MELRNPEALKAFVGKGRGRVMTAAELARRVGKSPGAISHLLTGRTERCTAELATAIEEELGLPSGVIFLAAEPVAA